MTEEKNEKQDGTKRNEEQEKDISRAFGKGKKGIASEIIIVGLFKDLALIRKGPNSFKSERSIRKRQMATPDAPTTAV